MGEATVVVVDGGLPEGPQGPEGPEGPSGEDGADGISCWDLDGDRACDPAEDRSGDGSCGAIDCQAPAAHPQLVWVDAAGTVVTRIPAGVTGTLLPYVDDAGHLWTINANSGAFDAPTPRPVRARLGDSCSTGAAVLMVASDNLLFQQGLTRPQPRVTFRMQDGVQGSLLPEARVLDGDQAPVELSGTCSFNQGSGGGCWTTACDYVELSETTVVTAPVAVVVPPLHPELR